MTVMLKRLAICGIGLAVIGCSGIPLVPGI
jgi:hypothetical protein